MSSFCIRLASVSVFIHSVVQMYEKQPIMVISVCDARDLLSLPL